MADGQFMERSMLEKAIKEKTFIICLMAALMLWARMLTGINMLAYIAFLAVSLGIIFDKLENKHCYIIFFITWVYIFKANLAVTSLVSYLVIIYLIVSAYGLMLNLRLCLPVFTFMALSGYVIALGLLNTGTRWMDILNFLAYMAIVFLPLIAAGRQIDFAKNVYYYTLGLLLATLAALSGNILPQVNLFLSQLKGTDTFISQRQLIERFTGLDIDPNYYSLQILIAIALLLVLIVRGQNRYTNILFVVFLLIAGVLAFSKMYLLVICFILMYTLFSLKGRDKVSAFIFISIIFLATSWLWYDTIYNAYLVRFFSESSQLNDVTTGRYDHWVLYFKEMYSNIKVFLFGTGIGVGYLQGVEPHNLYIITLYRLGIIGSTLFIYFLLSTHATAKKFCEVKLDRRFLDISFLPLLVLLIANFSLDSLQYTFFSTHLFLVIQALLPWPGVNLKSQAANGLPSVDGQLSCGQHPV